MRLGLVIAMVAGVLSGCADSAFGGGTDDFIDMDTPPANCSGGPGCPSGATGSPEGGGCFDSDDCLGSNACVAPFVDGQVGDFTCSSQCIDLGDEAAWCLDALACCDPDATCSSRGLCVISESGNDSGTSADGSSGTGATGSGDASETGGSGSAGQTESSESGAATSTTGMR